MHSEQRKGEEQGTPIVVLNDERTKMTTAKVAPSKGVDVYAVDSVSGALEQLGHRRIVLRRNSEPAMLALQEAARRESDLEIL